jgi:hypothetical protein
VIAVLVVVVGPVYVQAATVAYDRFMEIFDQPASSSRLVITSMNCSANGEGSFSFIANGTMDNGNSATVTGSAVLVLNKNGIPYPKTYSGQWVEHTSTGDITGTFSVKNYTDRRFLGTHGCVEYGEGDDYTGYIITVGAYAPFRGKDAQGRAIKGEVNIQVSERDLTNTSTGEIESSDILYGEWSSTGFPQ